MKKGQFYSVIYFAIVIGIIVLGIKHFHIPDFCVIVPETLFTSGQPRGMDYPRLLYKYHISTIVNVRSSSEHRDKNWYNEEVAWTKENAVKYIELPIGKQDYFPDSQIQSEFLSLMSNRESIPVLLHGSGDDKRIAMLTAVWLRKSQQLSTQDTIKQVGKIIDNRPLTKEEIDFIDSLH